MATGRDVVIRLRGDISDFQAKMVAAGKSIGAATDKITGAEKEAVKFRQGLTDVADTAGKIGATAAIGLGAVTKAAMDWESAWAGVTKTVDGTASEMAHLEEELRGLTAVLPASHAEIAAVAEAAGQLGVAQKDIAAFTRTMIDLGETTNLTSDEAATSIAQMANVMQTAPDEVDNLGAALVALGNAGASTERDIILMAQRISGAGAQIGLAEADILAIANAAASMGIEVEAGGTAVSRIFTDMAKAVATGEPKLETFAQTAQMSSQAFVTAFEEDPARAFAAFTQGLDAINKSGGDVFTTLDQLDLSDVRVQNALLGMAASGNLLADSLDLGAKAWEENTALADEAAKRYETSGAKMQIAWNQIRDAAIDFGDVALPVLASAAEGVATLAGVFSDLPRPVQAAGTALMGITAVTGGSLWFGAKVVRGITDTRAALQNLGISAEGAGKRLQSAAKAGTAVAAAAALGQAIDSWDDAALSARELDLALRDLASGEVNKNLRDLKLGADGLGDALKSAAWDDIDFLSARDEIEGLDEALANLADQDASQAAAAFKTITAEGKAAGLSIEEITNLFPEYAAALEIGANAAVEASDSTWAAAHGIEAIGDAADGAETPVDRLGQALGDLEAVIEGRQSFRDYEQALDDFADRLKERQELAKELKAAQRDLSEAETPADRQAAREEIARLREELADYALTLDEGEQAGREWQESLEDLALGALNAATQLTGLDQKRYLRKARRDFIDAALELGETRREARLLWEELTNLDEVDPTITVVYKTKGLNSLRNQQKLFGDTYATGGPVYGRGTGTSDDIPAWLSNGEYVIKAAAVAKYGTAMFDQLNTMRFAEGGMVRSDAYRGLSHQTTNHYYAQGGAVAGGGISIDYDRLASAMLSARPLYGDVYVQGGAEEFRRIQQEDQRRAASDGVRR